MVKIDMAKSFTWSLKMVSRMAPWDANGSPGFKWDVDPNAFFRRTNGTLEATETSDWAKGIRYTSKYKYEFSIQLDKMNTLRYYHCSCKPFFIIIAFLADFAECWCPAYLHFTMPLGRFRSNQYQNMDICGCKFVLHFPSCNSKSTSTDLEFQGSLQTREYENDCVWLGGSFKYFYFPLLGGNGPIWRMFFRWGETTN